MTGKTFWYLILLSVCDAQGQMLIQQIFGSRDNIQDTINFNKEYDFIVIGGGSSGSVVANRLSENKKWSILLLEAGEDETFLTDVPLTAAIQTITKNNWGYKSEKFGTACLGLVDRKCNMPRGKVLGGTSVLNFLLYTRGNKQDYDEWERLGNAGWGYEDVLPYFIKSENCTLCENVDSNYHGTEGYLHIEHPKFESPIIESFLEAGKSLGYKIGDPNGKHGLTFSKVQATMLDGARCSANKAFLKPISNRSNLHISMRSRVVKILIDPKTKVALGVRFIKNRKVYNIRTSKEVILSAGAINSPFLLMHSGIGPKEDLERVNISVIQDLKVGYNLQDHMAFSVLAFLVNESITISDIGVQTPVHILNYLINGRGPYTVPGGACALGFVQTKYSNKKDYPDVELVLGCGAINGDIYGSLRALLGIPDDLYRKVYGNILARPAFGIAPVLLRPKSRGRVTLKDDNPLHWPVLKPNYFESEKDVDTLVEGIKMAINISLSTPFRRFSTNLHSTPLPQCQHLPFASDAYWACGVRHVATTLGHQVGTCKMGPDSDPDAVLDPQLRVRGIHKLRVIDAAAMPNIVAGHTNSVAMMIGEKGSDMLKMEYVSKQ